MNEGEQLKQVEPGELGIAQTLPDQRRVEHDQRAFRGERYRLAAGEPAHRAAPLGEPGAAMRGMQRERRERVGHVPDIGDAERMGNGDART